MEKLKIGLENSKKFIKEETKNFHVGRQVFKYIVSKGTALLNAAAEEDREDIKHYTGSILTFIYMNGPEDIPEKIIKFNEELKSSMKKYEMEKEHLLSTLNASLSASQSGNISVESLMESFGEDPDIQYEYAIESCGALLGNLINLTVTEKPLIKINEEESEMLIKNLLMVLYSHNIQLEDIFKEE